MMNDANPLESVAGREQLLAELARREGGQQGPPLSEAQESTVREVAAGLETLAQAVRLSPPPDEFAEESDCQRAIERVEQIAQEREFSTPKERFPEIGPYEVLGQLGQGGMGAVFKATHRKLRRAVALKILPHASLKDAAAVERFEREMTAVGALQHPNIVTAHDAGEVDGMHYLVMEYVDGLDLSTLVRRVGPLRPADASEIVRQAALGLEQVHRIGIVHRDIKPSNIMLAVAESPNAEPTVKVLDFGLALLAPCQADDAELTSTGQIMGTLNYMAPEQCSESHLVDERADVYSLGATLYRLLCGRPPFGDDRFASPMSLIAALASEEPTPLAQLRSDLPPRLIAAVEQMMAKDPERRFASARKVAEALAPFAVGADLRRLVRATPRQTNVDPTFHGHSDTAARLNGAQKRSAGRRMILMLAAALGVVASLVASIWVANWPEGHSLLSWVHGETWEVEARNRQAAEWLSAQRATYGIGTEQSGYLEVATGLQPPTYPFVLETVDLSGNRSIRDEDLNHLRDLPNLSLIQLTDTSIGDEGLRHLKHLPGLVHLFLSGTRVTDAGLGELKHFKQLETLHLASTAVSDAGLRFVAELPALKELSLAGCPITDEGLKHLKSLRRLELLWIADTRATQLGIHGLQSALPQCRIESAVSGSESDSSTAVRDVELAYQKSRQVAEWLSSVRASYGVSAPSAGFIQLQAGDPPPTVPFLLNTVSLGQNSAVRDEDLKRLHALPTFVTLVLNDTNIGDQGLRNLGELPALSHLYLSGTRVSDSGLAEMKRFPKLATLHLYGTAVTNAGLKHLSQNEALTELQLVGCLISGTGIPDLKRLTGLKMLYLQNTAVTLGDLVELQRAMPDCRIETSFSEDDFSAATEDSRSGGRKAERKPEDK